MTRLTLHGGRTKRVHATFFASKSDGLARDLAGLMLMDMDTLRRPPVPS